MGAWHAGAVLWHCGSFTARRDLALCPACSFEPHPTSSCRRATLSTARRASTMPPASCWASGTMLTVAVMAAGWPRHRWASSRRAGMLAAPHLLLQGCEFCVAGRQGGMQSLTAYLPSSSVCRCRAAGTARSPLSLPSTAMVFTPQPAAFTDISASATTCAAAAALCGGLGAWCCCLRWSMRMRATRPRQSVSGAGLGVGRSGV